MVFVAGRVMMFDVDHAVSDARLRRSPRQRTCFIAANPSTDRVLTPRATLTLLAKAPSPASVLEENVIDVIQYEPARSYARASRVGNLIFLAGEVGRDEHGAMVPGGITEQTARVFEHIRSSLELFGLGFEDLVRMDVFLLNEEDVHPFLEVMKRYLPSGSPPGALLCVKAFSHAGMLVEIECIAAGRA